MNPLDPFNSSDHYNLAYEMRGIREPKPREPMAPEQYIKALLLKRDELLLSATNAHDLRQVIALNNEIPASAAAPTK